MATIYSFLSGRELSPEAYEGTSEDRVYLGCVASIDAKRLREEQEYIIRRIAEVEELLAVVDKEIIAYKEDLQGLMMALNIDIMLDITKQELIIGEGGHIWLLNK